MWQRLFLHQVSGILLARILPSMLLCYHSDPVAVWLRQDQDPKDGAQTLQSQVVVPADPLESGEWQAKSRKMRAKFKMSVNDAPWTGRKDNPPQLRGLPRSKRVMEAAQISTYMSLVVGCQPVHQQVSIRRAHPVSHHQHNVVQFPGGLLGKRE
jgi:hypothetical protein